MKFSVLGEPFPFSSKPKKDFFTALLFGLFVFLFLTIFQPFGLSNYQTENKTIELAGYGLVTFSILVTANRLTSIIFPKWFSKATWTVGKNIIYTTFIFVIIGLGNLSYSVFLNYLDFSLKGFLFYQVWTVLIGFFPVTISTLFVYNKRLKNSILEADSLNSSLLKNESQSHNQIEIPSQNKSENLQLDLFDLLSVKAVENYIEVYRIKNGELDKSILRNTLKSIENTLAEFDSIKKCHRSYLVNLKNVNHFSGNAQGLSLHFDEKLDLVVPVSRAYVNEIKSHLTA